METHKQKMEGKIMLTKEELKEYAKQVNLNLGQAEKDYFQNIILFILSQSYGNEIVFKGGTALKKCYGLNRFSEDLDFTCSNKISLQPLVNSLKRFKMEFELDKKEYKDGLKVILKIKGPLYIGINTSLCRFIIDFSFRENVILKPEIKTLGRFLEEIPSFDVLVMQEKEIAAEKIRAIMTRNKARDVYDLWFLMQKAISLDKNIIQQKLDFYKEKWDQKKFEKALIDKKSIWESELKPLIFNIPNFNDTVKFILSRLNAS